MFYTQFKTSGRCMAQKYGKQNVWLNFEVSTKVHSIIIEYDPDGSPINSANDLGTTFTRGYFDSSQYNSSAGQHFTSSKNPISALEIHKLVNVMISDYTVTFYFPSTVQETKALYIKEEKSNARDYVSIIVSFTDYEPSATVCPKMSQPGKS